LKALNFADPYLYDFAGGDWLNALLLFDFAVTLV
jgi:hypothetical protein